jgi:hypothetical protein
MRSGTDSSMARFAAPSALRLRVLSKWRHEPFRPEVHPSTNMTGLDMGVALGLRLDGRIRARTTLISEIDSYVRQYNEFRARTERIFNTVKARKMLASSYPDRAK